MKDEKFGGNEEFGCAIMPHGNSSFLILHSSFIFKVLVSKAATQTIFLVTVLLLQLQ